MRSEKIAMKIVNLCSSTRGSSGFREGGLFFLSMADEVVVTTTAADELFSAVVLSFCFVFFIPLPLVVVAREVFLLCGSSGLLVVGFALVLVAIETFLILFCLLIVDVAAEALGVEEVTLLVS